MTRFTLALLCLIIPFASASAQGHAPSDQGSMAFPQPVPGSGTNRPAVAIPDTGSMQTPQFPASTGHVQTAPTGRDTGSTQQYPASK